jgi:hypothetical protein
VTDDQATLTDEEITTTRIPGSAVTHAGAQAALGDADGTDGDAEDGTDGDATDLTDGDATDGTDGDATDADGEDA